MSVNFQREFSLVGGGVRFAPVAALGRRTKRSGFISGPDLWTEIQNVKQHGTWLMVYDHILASGSNTEVVLWYAG